MGALLAFAATRARPDEAVSVTFLIVEEIGEDGSIEARVIELEAQVVATLVGALGPGGADVGPADEDPMAGSVVSGCAGFGDDADAAGLNAEGDDFAGELVVGGLLEGADGSHGGSP